ncbi:MAG: DUF4255 domain-containing protein [Anaerolineae bacterium]|nr:MAG: DUF4255 domain-containing protein [Anaerolineae bacterium]
MPPLPVDLYYAFAPWAKTALAEHRLLGWLMRTLEDSNTLNSGQLNAYSGAPGLFAADETVTLIPDSLSARPVLPVGTAEGQPASAWVTWPASCTSNRSWSSQPASASRCAISTWPG